MSFWNYNHNEITIKIVYYGPALSGKTECLRYIDNRAGIKKKGKFITLDSYDDRTLFFDYIPFQIALIKGFLIKVQLYTVPGMQTSNTNRKLVLQGTDGVVFVADSQVVRRDLNIESLQNLKENMKANKISFTETPIIFQYNKRDLKEILPVDILNKDLNPDNRLFFTTCAITGENIIESLKAIVEMVIPKLIDRVKHEMVLQEESNNSLTPGGKIENKFLLPLSKFDINEGFNNEDEKISNNDDSQKRNEMFDLNDPIEKEEMKIEDEQTVLKKEDEIFVLNEEEQGEIENEPSAFKKEFDFSIIIKKPDDRDEVNINLDFKKKSISIT